MNKNLYRIVFNKRRGQLMVVSESAASQGKAAGGEGVGAGGGSGIDWRGGPAAALRPLGLAVLAALGMGLPGGAAHAQIVADQNAPARQRPTVVQTANGVTQVNIQTPSAAGVSRNSYSQFDVQSGGAILNNSRNNAQTQLGGWLQGNPWLTAGGARVILNEVNSSNPSQLRGYVEVAGQRAEVVIANPAGVNVDGAGFINASRVTLTTGAPVFNGGGLDGYLVQRGMVTINGKGLDAAASDYTGILARAVQVNAGIWAKELRVVTGANQIDAGHGAAAAVAGTGAAPTFALDVAQLGGMYAGKIHLIGTEAGMGARNAGVLAASAGELVLQSNGWLSNSGNIQATAEGAKAALSAAGDIGNAGTIYAGGDARVTAQGNIASSGLIGARNHTAVLAEGAGSRVDIAAGAVVASGLNADNTLGAAGDLELRASGAVAIHGSSASGGHGRISGAQLDLRNAGVSGAHLTLEASNGGVDASHAAITTQGALEIAARQDLRTDSAALTANQIGIRAHDLSNAGGQILQLGVQDMSIQTSGMLDNSGGRIATNSHNLTLGADTLGNVAGSIEHAGTGTLTIAAASLLGQRGKIAGNGGVAIAAGTVDHRDATMVGGQLSINAGTLDNRAGRISQTGEGQTTLNVSQVLDNTGGKIETAGNAGISAATLMNAQGRITSTQSVRVATGAALNNAGGTIAAGQHLVLRAADLDNNQGILQAYAGDLTLQVNDLDNSAGSVYAGRDLSTSAANVSNSGKLYAAGKQTLRASGTVSNTGVIAAQGDNSISANLVHSGAASLLGAGVKVDGSLSNTGNLDVSSTQAMRAGGQNLAAGNANLRAASIDLSGSQTGAANLAVTALNGNITTRGAVVGAAGTLAMTATANDGQTLDNSKGRLSAGQLELNVGHLTNTDGTVVQVGAGNSRIALSASNGVLDNTGGLIAAEHDLSLTGGSASNIGGVLRSGGDMSVGMRGDLRNTGLMYAGRDQRVEVGGALSNTGSMAARGNAAIAAGSLRSSGLLGAGVNGDGSLAAAGNLTLTARQNLQAGGQNLAAGDAALSGAGVDVGGSQTSAANLALTAASGDVNTSTATVSAAGLLRITANANNAQALVNTEGKLGAGQLLLNLANLRNGKGDIVQTGAGDTTIDTGVLDNTAGRIAVNSANLSLRAGTLGNAGGKIEHAGAGTLAIEAATLNGQRGQITANGALNMSAGVVDHRDASTVARQITVTASDLDNRAGQLIQLGNSHTSVQVSQKLDNAGGRIETNGAASIAAATLDNGKGRITSRQSASVGAVLGLDNSDGTIAASQDLVLTAGNVKNSRGVLQAVSGNATLQVADFNNEAGNLVAGADLHTVADNVDNSGNLYAAGKQTLLASGTVGNKGVIAALGDVDIRAGSLHSGAASLLGAGVKLDGALAQSGNLSVSAAQGIAALGQNLAAGDMTLGGAFVDIAGSQTGAANIAITAHSGNVSTSNAEVGTPGTLAISARAQDAQSWTNIHGAVSAGQLAVQVGKLNNSTGKIIQTGTGDTTINVSSPSGQLDNTSGRIAVNSRNLTLGAHTVINVDGSMEHAGGGAFAIDAVTFNGQRGRIVSNGALNLGADSIDHRSANIVARQISIAAGNLDNSQGGITQLGGDKTSIVVGRHLDNRGGGIASNGDTSIGADTVNNQGGTLQAAGAAGLNISAAGRLDNGNKGTIAAGGNATVAGGVILNQLGQITAGGNLDLAAAQGLDNAQGLLAASANVDLKAASFDNAGGKLAAIQGNVRLATIGATGNDGGKIQAAGDVSLNNGGLANTGAASIIGGNVAINTNGQALNNRLGTIAGIQGVDLQSGAIDNDAGLIQAGTALAIDTGGKALLNTNAAGYAARHTGAGGISSGGAAKLNIGNWNNAGGYFGAAGAISGRSGYIDNTAAGKIVGRSSLKLDLAGLNNQGGQIQAVGDIDLNAGAGRIDNRQGLLRTGAAVTLSAAALDNSATKGSEQGIEGMDVVVKTADLNNTTGAIRADNNLSIDGAGTVNNSQGLLSAGNALSLRDYGASRSLAVTNADGTAIAAKSLDIRAASISGGGRLLSKQDLTIDVTGNYSHGAGGEIAANRNVSLIVAGNLGNAGKLQAGGTLDIRADNIDNTATGDINAGLTRLSIARMLSNRGVIDGLRVELNAARLDNTGTGRIYGDQLSVAAGVLNNDVENGVAATIAARARLDIGAQTINNHEHALIFSAGDLAIGGSIDASRQAAGQAGSVANASASIEALGNLNLNAVQVNNLNNHFSTQPGAADTPEWILEYQSKGASKRTSELTPPCVGPGSVCWKFNKDYEWTEYEYSRTTRGSTILSSDPGRIVAGGNLAIKAVNVFNDNSHIIAGGLLAMDPATLTNNSTQGTQTRSDVGTATTYRFNDNQGSTEMAPPLMIRSEVYKLETTSTAAFSGSRVEQHTLAAATGTKPAAATSAGVSGNTSAAGSANAGVNVSSIAKDPTQVGGVNSASGLGASAATGASGSLSTTRTDGLSAAGAVGVATGAVAERARTAAGDGAQIAILVLPGIPAGDVKPVGGTAGVGTVAPVAPAKPSGGAQLVRTVPPAVTLPNASLFKVSPAPDARYLVETDPRFANYREWSNSDYLLSLVKLDPTVTQKRLGDGFYEQRLVREQIAELTGQRFLGNYSADEEQYRGLMDAAASYAKQWHLRPGVALTAEQMAGLTNDIVWLVERDVALADGSTQKALVPQVYVRLREGDLDVSGALLAGKDIDIKLGGDLSNSGTIAGRDVVRLTADNVHNLGGRIHGEAVGIAAKNDLNNIGGAISANSALAVDAGHDIKLTATISSTRGKLGAIDLSGTGIDRVAGLYVTGDGGTLLASAGRDVTLQAGVIGNSGKDGATLVKAGGNVNLGVVTTGNGASMVWGADYQGRDGSSADTGSKIAGVGSVSLDAKNDINATLATVKAGATLIALAGNDINNSGSTLTAGKELLASAGRDVNIVSTTLSSELKYGGASFAGTHVDKVAGLYVTDENGGALNVVAGRDVKLLAGVIGNAGKDGATGVVAGRDLNVGTLATSSSQNYIHDEANYRKENRSGEAGSQIQAAGSLALSAKNDVNVRAGDVQAGAQLLVSAGNNINVTAGVATHHFDAASRKKEEGMWSSKTTTKRDTLDTVEALGSSLGGKTVAMLAGNDLALNGSAVRADDTASLAAGRDLTIASATNTHSESHFIDVKKSGFSGNFYTGIGYSRSAAKQTMSAQGTTQAGASVSGGSVALASERDIVVRGSTVVADRDVDVAAGRDLNVLSAQDTHSSVTKSSSSQSGFGGSFFKPWVGKMQSSQDGTTGGVSQAGSQIASLGGDVALTAGARYTQTASEVLALGTGVDGGLPGDIAIGAQSVLINEAYNTSMAREHTEFSKVSLGASASIGLIDAISAGKDLVELGKAAGKTKDGRMKALAAATVAVKGQAAYNAIAQGGGGVSISISLGSSKSESNTLQTGSEAVGSAVKAAGDVSIVAGGAGKDSDLTVVGSKINAGNDVELRADGDIALLAAHNTSKQTSKNSSSGASFGVGFAAGGAQNGMTFNMGINHARGNANGADDYASNTDVRAGNTARLGSGGDTVLRGAVLAAGAVKADVGGDLRIASLQDTSSYDSKQSGGGFGVNLCLPPFCYGVSTASGSVSQSKAKGNFASVTEQSGIKAGDGGFQVAVHGNTDLKGGVLASSDKAAGEGKNALSTGTLSTSDLRNKDEHAASGFSLGATFSGKMGDQSGAASETDKSAANGKATPSGSAGIGSASGGQDSSTPAGISGGTVTIRDGAQQAALTGKTGEETVAGLNRDVSSEKDGSGALAKGWDGKRMEQEVQAQVQITAAFGQAAAKGIGDYADRQRDAAIARGDAAEAAKWDEGGAYRVAAHAAAGALGGGLGGALGAGLSAKAMPVIGDLIDDMGLPEPVRQALSAAAAGAIGAVAGGGAGVAGAFNTDVNNRMMHSEDRKTAKALAARSGGQFSAAQVLAALRYSGLKDSQGNVIVGEGTQETFVKNVNIKTGISVQDTVKEDPTIPFVGGDSVTLLEKPPTRPSNELISFIIENTGGKASPYILTFGPVYTNGPSLPAAPPGTQRVTVMVDGTAYYPLAASCPAAGCTNGDPIANAIPDDGTKAYNEAVARKTEKDLNVASGLLGGGGALVRGVNAVSKLATAAAANAARWVAAGANTTIAASSPAEIAWGYGKLSTRQQGVLDQLPETLSQLTFRKSQVSVTDLAAMTAQTGDEFALFTRGSQRLVIRGSDRGVPLLPEEITALREQGYKWSGHSHPGTSDIVLDASGVFGKPQGDRYVLDLLNQQRSVIVNSAGRRSVFDQFDNYRVK
ncbi:hemagglutinin repeat-containing protein [Janthinobacterium fluminis]|uniref:Hemagglutinin repeat-containing protein n=1 Tax=Janthinobacterium fluminis TaxID=2987524 RepID=A0ABT5K6B9_9BURK|nr:hemagglutinin repeat-containing protein [Janthinobacterium fluminis]MDC8760326.1 hemagglutinin repeat-containing protein [Janthinobacterium fluminis]